MNTFKPTNIFQLFEKARQSLKWPQLKLQIDGKMVRISGSSRDSTVLFLSNGKSQFNGRITYGYVHRTDTGAHVKWEKEIEQIKGLRILLPALLRDPIQFCTLHGLEFKFCCFCGAELTTKESVFAGYGPICAEKWGLPWGQTAESTIKDTDL